MVCMGRGRGRGRDAWLWRPARWWSGGCLDRLLGLRGAGAGVARRGEELDAADHLVVVAGLAVLFPLVVLEAPVDRDQPAGAEHLRGGFAGLAERRDVDVAGLAAGRHVIDGEAELAHGPAVGQLAELRVAGQSSCDGQALHVRFLLLRGSGWLTKAG